MNDEISVNLRLLNKLAKILKKKRIAAGALTLSSLEVKFIKNETQNPIDVEMYQLRETNSMVEEFMLLANISVAQKIHQHFPSFALLRYFHYGILTPLQGSPFPQSQEFCQLT